MSFGANPSLTPSSVEFSGPEDGENNELLHSGTLLEKKDVQIVASANVPASVGKGSLHKISHAIGLSVSGSRRGQGMSLIADRRDLTELVNLSYISLNYRRGSLEHLLTTDNLGRTQEWQLRRMGYRAKTT